MCRWSWPQWLLRVLPFIGLGVRSLVCWCFFCWHIISITISVHTTARLLLFLILKRAFNHRKVREYNGYCKTIIVSSIIRIVNKMTVDNQQNKHCHWSRPLLNIGMVMVSRMFYFQFFSTKMWVYYYWSTSVRLVRHLSRGTKLFFWYSSRNWTRECFSPLNLCTWCTQLTVVWVLLEFVQACLNKLNGFKTYSSWSATAKAIH